MTAPTLFTPEVPAATTAAGPPAATFGDPRLPERFWSKAVVAGDGCWTWTRETDHDGYGRVRYEGIKRMAHRVAYAALGGSVPDDLQLDHLCRVRNCVNPAHLEPVTNRTNTLRGNGPTAVNSVKTHCPQGHPYDRVNTHFRPCGRRRCRACERVRNAQYRARKAAA
jgi:hypothetical protein